MKKYCNYQGYEFGANYPDSVCIDGQLYDADACDEDKNLFEPMDYIPCPMCHPIAYIAHYAEYYSGASRLENISCWYYAIRNIAVIWKNRLFKTEPWKTGRRRAK